MLLLFYKFVLNDRNRDACMGSVVVVVVVVVVIVVVVILSEANFGIWNRLGLFGMNGCEQFDRLSRVNRSSSSVGPVFWF
jgi:hypothetical protein